MKTLIANKSLYTRLFGWKKFTIKLIWRKIPPTHYIAIHKTINVYF